MARLLTSALLVLWFSSAASAQNALQDERYKPFFSAMWQVRLYAEMCDGLVRAPVQGYIANIDQYWRTIGGKPRADLAALAKQERQKLQKEGPVKARGLCANLLDDALGDYNWKAPNFRRVASGTFPTPPLLSAGAW